MSLDLCFSANVHVSSFKSITKHTASKWWEIWSLKALANVDLPIPPIPTIPRLPTVCSCFSNWDIFSWTPIKFDDSLMLLALTYKNINISKVSDDQMIYFRRSTTISQFNLNYFGLIHNFNNLLTSMINECDDVGQFSWTLEIDVELSKW